MRTPVLAAAVLSLVLGAACKGNQDESATGGETESSEGEGQETDTDTETEAGGDPGEAAGGAGDVSGDELVSQMETLVEEACACEDKACLDKSMKEINELGRKLQEGQLSDEQMSQVEQLGPKMQECAQSIMGGGPGGGAEQGGDAGTGN